MKTTLGALAPWRLGGLSGAENVSLRRVLLQLSSTFLNPGSCRQRHVIALETRSEDLPIGSLEADKWDA